MIANELRIGNWVDYEGQFKQVASIDPTREYEELKCAISLRKYINVRAFGWEHRWLNHLKPIKLTPEILLKCGFEFLKEDISDCNVDYSFPNSHYWIQNHTECNDYVFYGENSSIEVSLKSLHQLQNLYYALTGDELEFKP